MFFLFLLMFKIALGNQNIDSLDKIVAETFSAQLKSASEIELMKKELLKQALFRNAFEKKRPKLLFVLDASLGMRLMRNDTDEYSIGVSSDLKFKLFNSNLRGEFSLITSDFTESKKDIFNFLPDATKDSVKGKFLVGISLPEVAFLLSNKSFLIHSQDPLNVFENNISKGLKAIFDRRVYGIDFSAQAIVGINQEIVEADQRFKGLLFLEANKELLNLNKERTCLKIFLGLNALQKDKKVLLSTDYNYDFMLGAKISTVTDIFSKLNLDITYYGFNQAEENLKSILNLSKGASILTNLEFKFKNLDGLAIRIGILEQNVPTKQNLDSNFIGSVENRDNAINREDLDNIFVNTFNKDEKLSGITSRFICEIVNKKINPYYIYEKDSSSFGLKMNINGNLNFALNTYILNFNSFYYKAKLSNELIDIRTNLVRGLDDQGREINKFGFAIKKTIPIKSSFLEFSISEQITLASPLMLNASFSFFELNSTFLENLSEKITLAGHLKLLDSKELYYNIYLILDGRLNINRNFNIGLSIAPGLDENENKVKSFFQLGVIFDARFALDYAQLEAKLGNFKREDIKSKGFEVIEGSACSIKDLSFGIGFKFNYF